MQPCSFLNHSSVDSSTHSARFVSIFFPNSLFFSFRFFLFHLCLLFIFLLMNFSFIWAFMMIKLWSVSASCSRHNSGVIATAFASSPYHYVVVFHSRPYIYNLFSNTIAIRRNISRVQIMSLRRAFISMEDELSCPPGVLVLECNLRGGENLF